MSSKNLLVELFVEELPPKALKKLGDVFATTLANALKNSGLAASTAAVTAYLQMIAAGVDAVQVFDSHGGHLSPQDFQQASGQWMKQIISTLNNGKPGSHPRDDGAIGDSLPANVPVIAFSLGTHGNWSDLTAMGSGLDLLPGLIDFGCHWVLKNYNISLG